MMYKTTAAADISKLGTWEVRGGVVSPAIHTGSPVPAQIMRELSCGCRSEQACVEVACGYQASLQDSMCAAIHKVWTNQYI